MAIKRRKTLSTPIFGKYSSESNSGEIQKKSAMSIRHLFRKIPAMLYSIDRQGRLIDVSDHWLEVMGYKRSEVIGKKSTDFLTEESRQLAQKNRLPKFYKLGFARDIPYQIVKKNGEIIDVLLSAASERDDSGEVVRSFAVLNDITEQKKAQEELRKSEATLQAIMDQIPGIVFQYILSPDGSFSVTFISNLVKGYWGYTAEEIMAAPSLVFKLLHPDDLDMVNLKIVESARTLKDLSIQHRIICPDDSIKWVWVKASPQPLPGGDILWNGILLDITEQKQLEMLLIESERRYRSLVEFSEHHMFLLDKDGKYISSNNRVENLGLESGQSLVGKYLGDVYPSETAELYLEQLKKVFNTGHAVSFEHSLQVGEKTCFHLDTLYPIFRENKIWAVGGICRDITQMKQALNTLQRKEAELLRQTRKIKKMNTALSVLIEKRIQDKKELEQNVLLNVKTLILPYLQRLKGKFDQDDILKYLNIIESNINEFVSPFANILSSNYTSLTPTEIQVADLIKQGKTSKEIASIFHISSKAVSFHRSNIRRKLGLVNKKINLATFLQTLR
ncbi:MAG: PAS domain S-box protein [Deltaproteobacteria bacterium]|nr:PAS domain S-box protein [Deltaproteobacteria bacterium]MBW1993809.1 PAS domain S-box protein [Deltaproteobacteria bacterium]MBW2154468.1 PAS domain S-box protein [Deltaproteobacteria bacterium]